MRNDAFVCGIGETRPFWAVLARRWWRNTRLVELRSWTLLLEAVAEQPRLPLLIDARWLREESQQARLMELQREFPEALPLAGVVADDAALIPQLHANGIQHVIRVTGCFTRLERLLIQHHRAGIRTTEKNVAPEEQTFDVNRLLARLPWAKFASR